MSIIYHSMARATLKKSKYFSTSTTTASNYIPKMFLNKRLSWTGTYFNFWNHDGKKEGCSWFKREILTSQFLSKLKSKVPTFSMYTKYGLSYFEVEVNSFLFYSFERANDVLCKLKSWQFSLLAFIVWLSHCVAFGHGRSLA